MTNMRKTLVAAALLVAVAGTWFAGTYRAQDSDAPKAPLSSSADTQSSGPAGGVRQAVARPFGDEVGVSVHNLRIEDPTRPSTLKLPSGTVVQVPANAFVDEAGKPVAEPVEISFSEFHDAADIIASGIPMHVHGGHGDGGWMQTAGMFELRGRGVSQSVEIAPGKAIGVSLVSAVDGAYATWYFDENRGDWVNLAPGTAPQGTVVSAGGLENEVAQLRRQTAQAPVDPTAVKQRKLRFSDLDVSACPELKGRKDLALVYAGTKEAMAPENNPEINDPGYWFRKELRPGKEKGLYQLTLSGQTMYSIPVRLALEGAELEAAKADYQKQLAEYRAQVELLQQKEQLLEEQSRFRRMMEVADFGIYNHDILLQFQEAVALNAHFDFGASVPEAMKEQVIVYLVTGGGRAVIPFSHWDLKKFRYLPEQDNRLVAVLPGKRVAYFSQSDFRAERASLMEGGDYTFKMRMEEGAVGSLADLRKLIDKARI